MTNSFFQETTEQAQQEIKIKMDDLDKRITAAVGHFKMFIDLEKYELELSFKQEDYETLKLYHIFQKIILPVPATDVPTVEIYHVYRWQLKVVQCNTESTKVIVRHAKQNDKTLILSV